MPEYFPEDLIQDLNKDRKEVLSDQNFYGPALDFLYDREEDFQTEEMVAELNSDSISRVDEYRAGCILGALRDEYDLIDGYFEEGNYRWNPELQAEGDWDEVRQELDKVNKIGKTKV